MPIVGASFARLARQAIRTHQTPVSLLAALLQAEVEEPERGTIDRRIKDARLPRFKTLNEFDLAEGGYVERAEPIILIGDYGAGNTHLAIGLCAAACLQKKRVRFTTAAGLVNELVEAQHHNLHGRSLGRWSRYDLIVLDEAGYVPFAQVGAELLFQIISELAE